MRLFLFMICFRSFYVFIVEGPFHSLAKEAKPAVEDRDIIRLFQGRNSEALRQTEMKYGEYCFRIAKNILGSLEDAEECVNDTLLKLWNTIPQCVPSDLKAFIAKTARNTALDRLRTLNAQKRGGGRLDAVLSELEACLPGGESPEEAYDAAALKALIDRFLEGLSARERGIFMQRYFFAEDTAAIARKYETNRANVRLILSRTRSKLKTYLKSEGY